MAISSSSLHCLMKHDVFLSFRGEDTRTKFTSHLEKKLGEKKIETYIDNRLEKGDNISTALIEAIRGAKMSIIVFSENYATSSWCLDEVLCIFECMKELGQVVLPVFYEVDPTNVRKQTESYEVAFAKLEERFEEDKVSQWRSVLAQVANLSGFHSLEYRTDSDLIDAIVKDIIKKLNNLSSSDNYFKDLVGIGKSVEEIEKLLCIDSLDVRIIGIWGMGGLGKTTLARVIFEQLSSEFEGCCFLQNVREESEKQGLHNLKKNMISVLLEEKGLEEITVFHKDRLRGKKVLVVLDDVDQPEQLDDLAGDQRWFGDGSRVIVTTRDDQVLRDRVDEKFELKGLSFESSLELFNLNAFKRNYSPKADDIELSKRVVNYAKGVPLALKVLGSYLRSRRRENWESEIDRLREVPNKTVQNALKISFDGLDEQEQRVFLDIVCFIGVGKGTCRCYVERKLGGDKSLKMEIDSLIDKSLICDEHNNLSMHDLVREMGHEIVRLQSVQEPGKRSRLLTEEDCLHILKNNTGTITIEGMSDPSSSWKNYPKREVELSPLVFKEMHRLRFLRLRHRDNMYKYSQELYYLPCSIKYLEWERWPFKSMPINFSSHNLVELKMPFSKLERLWGHQDLGNLKYVDLQYSYRLIDVSALSQAPNLESVDLSLCTRLRHVPSLRFRKIEESYHDCANRGCHTLGHLNLYHCYDLKSLSNIYGNVKELDIRRTLIEELPSSFTSLLNLKCLKLKYCVFLKNLPDEIRNLHSLTHLDLGYCSSLAFLPLLPRNLKWLNLRNTAIERVPSEVFECLSKLEELDLSRCTRLNHLPTSICKLKSLKRLSLDFCYRLEIFPEILEPMECLETLVLTRTGIRELPKSIENLTGLREKPRPVTGMRNILITTSSRGIQETPLSNFELEPIGSGTNNTDTNVRALTLLRRRLFFYPWFAIVMSLVPRYTMFYVCCVVLFESYLKRYHS